MTGFLGSGKTTLLERIHEQLADRRVLFLVNEFAPKDVDGVRLQLEPGRLAVVTGGSIFCKCKVTDFIQELTRAVELRPEGVVIEASGMADPTVTARMLAETGLDAELRLAHCVCVIDPGSFHKLLQTLPNMAAQVRAADLVLINKSDCHSADAIERCRAQAAELNPEAAIVLTSHCAHAGDWLGRPERAHPHAGEFAPCRDFRYANLVVPLQRPVDLARLQAACQELGDGLYRAKGPVPTAAGSRDVDYSASGWQERPVQTDAHQLVLIGAGTAVDRLQALADDLRDGRFDGTT
ncbi:MAG: CobW family GTP-binding protein [Planctomycetota bacterium]